jgi:hypothetical protein
VDTWFFGGLREDRRECHQSWLCEEGEYVGEIGRRLSPLETRMLWACYWWQRWLSFAVDRVLGNSVWVIKLVVCSSIALCTAEAGD